jgi:hypothetical protein
MIHMLPQPSLERPSAGRIRSPDEPIINPLTSRSFADPCAHASGKEPSVHSTEVTHETDRSQRTCFR